MGWAEWPRCTVTGGRRVLGGTVWVFGGKGHYCIAWHVCAECMDDSLLFIKELSYIGQVWCVVPFGVLWLWLPITGNV